MSTCGQENDFRTYWTFTEKERAFLTDEQVERLEKIELMTKGLVIPSKPELLPVPEVVIYGGRRAYECAGLYFEALEDAQALSAMPFFTSSYVYGAGYENKYLSEADRRIKEVTVYDKVALEASTSANGAAGAAEKENKNRLAEYREQLAKVEEALGAIREDLQQCRWKLHSMQAVVIAWREYLELASGDKQMAFKFLSIHHGALAEAADWCDCPELAEMVLLEAAS